MSDKIWIAAALTTAVLGAFSLHPETASAQSGPAASKPDQSEASHQDSSMGPATGNRDGANNGVGTQGSLDSSPGKASSTVVGVHGGKTGIGSGSSTGAGGPLESDPTQGGSKKPQ